MAIWLRVVVMSASLALGYLTALSGRRVLTILAAPGEELAFAHYVIFVLPTWLAMGLFVAAARTCLDGPWARLVGRAAFGCAVGMAALPPLRLALATSAQSAVLPSWLAYLRDRAAVSGGTGFAAGLAGIGAGLPVGAACGAAALIWLMLIQEYWPPGGLAGMQALTALAWGALGGLAGGAVAMLVRAVFIGSPGPPTAAGQELER